VRYQPDGPPALDRVSLDLPPGRRLALVGANGAGKSTLAAVLLRFRELSGGAALLNGHDLASYAADDVRSVIGGCPQDPHLFDATIRDNLRLARPGAADEELEAAAARARLLAWIMSLPQGLDTRVGTHGTAVSGGERQRLALARAFLADPALLILDEPTAHLDPDSRQALTADLLHATEGRAVLFITHESDGLDQVDQIVVLDHGRVAEQGSHHQLRHAGGPYQRMRESSMRHLPTSGRCGGRFHVLTMKTMEIPGPVMEARVVRSGMGRTVRHEEILRRLAIIDDGFVEDQAGLGLGLTRARVLDPKTAALVRVGALAAIGSPAVCLEWSSTRALEAGATEDEVTGVLLAIAPVAGLARVVAAVPGVADAFGYDIEAALEDPDDH
jgi:ABC-type multidrug transport system ATPase subunit/alkylhydroperoxidase/carboxymuconolactone decarboxylase family protein YurZ